MPSDHIDDKLLRALFESRIPVAVLLWRPLVNEGWPVEYASPNVVHVLGYAAEDFVSGRVVYREIVHPDDVERVTREVEENSASGTAGFEHLDYRIIDPSGRVRWVRDDTVVIRDDAGQITYYLGYVLDSTARHEALEALALATQQAEAALGAKAEFLATVSHELRTPLALVLGSVDALLEGQMGPLGERATRAVQRVMRNALRLRRLVDDLLDFAMLEERRTEVHWERLDAGALLSGLVEEECPGAEARGIDLTIDVSAVAVPITADRAMLERIAFNLVDNALKFTPSGGAVRVRVRSDQDGFELEVTDTGPGIPRDQQARIWERFERLQTPTRPQGVGLGLALIRAYTALMGGTVGVESEPGRGARFWVRLPHRAAPSQPVVRARKTRRPPVEKPRVAPPEGEVASPRARVLIADDNADMRSLIAELLGPSYESEEAADGPSTLAAARDHAPDVIVCDIMMPGMDGLEVVRRLKADAALRNIPVILVTARAGRQEIVAGLGAGADDYVAKPFEPAELRARVEAAVRLRHNFLLLARKHQELEVAHRALRDLQEQFVQTAKLAAIGQFTAGISHELNNPLATILLHTQGLLRQLPDGASHASLLAVRLAAERCRTVMRTILDYARAAPRETGPVQVERLLGSIVTLSGAQARSRDVVVEVERSPPGLPEVKVAEQEIATALLNVLSNALDATPCGGRVTLGAVTRVHQARPGVEVTVTDTGSGIAPAVLPLIFEPFFTTKAAGQGTGLGLSLARRMVVESGGHIDADSTPGQGTTIRVWLPAVQP